MATTMEFKRKYGPWGLVLGASEGTGAAFARFVAQSGINVVIVARRSAILEELAAELRQAHSVECLALPLDLASQEASVRLADATNDLEIGLVIMNAGADDHGRDFLDVPVQEWLELVQRNNVFTVQLCHHFGQPMRDRRRGGLILVNSAAGWGGAAKVAIYSASKAFDRNFAEALWVECAPFGVDVLSLIAPPTDTPALRRLLARGNLPAAGLASAEEVAREGLDHLGHGPVHIPHESSTDFITAASRRDLVLMMSEGTKSFFPAI